MREIVSSAIVSSHFCKVCLMQHRELVCVCVCVCVCMCMCVRYVRRSAISVG